MLTFHFKTFFLKTRSPEDGFGVDHKLGNLNFIKNYLKINNYHKLSLNMYSKMLKLICVPKVQFRILW